MSDDLSRHYRRLIRVYPPGSRRDELLDTLLECAPAGRRRPAPGEAVNLLRYGARARLGRPSSTAVVVIAVLVSLAGAFLGAAGAARLSWETAPALPSGAEATELTSTVFPGMTVWGGGDAALFVDQPDGDGIEYGHADYWVKHTAATRDVPGFAEAVRQRLDAAGWRIRSDVRPDVDPGSEPTSEDEQYTRSFWATRDGLVLDFSIFYWPGRPWYDSDGAAMFELSRAEPPHVLLATALGGLLGAMAGWLLTGWVSRRTEPSRVSTAVVSLTTGFALVLMLPAMLLALGPIVQRIGAPDERVSEPFWMGLVYLGDGPAILAGFLILGILPVSALPRSTAALQERIRQGRATRRRLRRALSLRGLRQRPVTLVALLTAVAMLSVAGLQKADTALAAGRQQCAPTVPPAAPDPADTRLSRVSRVFVSTQATPDQLNLIEAAIHRVTAATGYTFARDSLSAEFRRTYCGGARLPQALGRILPWYYTVWFSSPGAFGALEAEVGRMPGVLAVQRAARDD